METMLQVMPGKQDRAGHSVISVRDQEVEKWHLASGDLPPSSSPAFRQSVETLKSMENFEYPENGDAESVASESSMASNASSNVPEDDCGDDDDAASPGLEEKNMKRCPSGGSIVTYDEAASKLREEGECERTLDRNTGTRPEGSQSNGIIEIQETSINACREMAESAGPAWTDDKHCSYLNSIEQTFVQNLYGPDYHTVDASGQDDQDCVESRPMYGTPHGRELFTSLQRGCYDQREYYRPHFLPTFGPSPSVLLSPWIQHFNPKAATPSHGTGSAGQDGEAAVNPATGLFESGGNSGSGDVKEEVMESVPNLNNPDTGFQVPLTWSSRYQSQHHASTSAHVRADASNQAKKRNCNFDPACDGTYRPKKLKATQRLLAEMDVELDEQFVLKQKYLKEEHQQHGHVNRGFDLNQELLDEDANLGDTPQKTPRDVTETIDFVSCFREPTMTSNNGSVPEEGLNQQSCGPKSHQDILRRQPEEGEFGEGTSGVNMFVDAATGHNAPPCGISFKTRQEEAYSNLQAELYFDEDEEFEILPRRSPRASKTYTWGTVGPRRRLHNECNVLVDSAALSGSVKDARDHDLPNKSNCD